jgi:hypothetical protein
MAKHLDIPSAQAKILHLFIGNNKLLLYSASDMKRSYALGIVALNA